MYLVPEPYSSPAHVVPSVQAPRPGVAGVQVAELLDRAGKEAEKARAQNLNVRTAQQVWKDRATAKPGEPAAK